MNSSGMSRITKVPSLLRRISFSFLLGFGLFVLGAGLQGVLQRRGVTRASIYLDDLVLGSLAGLMAFAYEHRRSREMRRKLEVVSAMNHHVRNALQTIAYVPYTEQAKQMMLIQQSVNRIQWALNEILPGEGHEAENFPPTAALTELKVDGAAKGTKDLSWRRGGDSNPR
jgi:hypothetical protein